MNQQAHLRHLSRSLFEGNPIDKGTKCLDLITHNMEYLFHHIEDEGILLNQYQCTQELARFLIQNLHCHGALCQRFTQQKHHFIFTIPVLSSIFALGVAKESNMFSDKDIEHLFISSFFKDIGMCTLDPNQYGQKNNGPEIQAAFEQHPKISVEIIKDTIPLNKHYFKLIENHHHPDLIPHKDQKPTNMTGFETLIINTMDMVANAITDKPLHKGIRLFEALEMVRRLITEHYTQEFKLIVSYFGKFHLKNKLV